MSNKLMKVDSLSVDLDHIQVTIDETGVSLCTADDGQNYKTIRMSLETFKRLIDISSPAFNWEITKK